MGQFLKFFSIDVVTDYRVGVDSVFILGFGGEFGYSVADTADGALITLDSEIGGSGTMLIAGTAASDVTVDTFSVGGLPS